MTSDLRYRKKAETRRRISDAARALFLEKGFDGVTVAEVAERAEVSPATVFNYFRTKQELFFSGLHAFETELLAAVRNREAGVSAVQAFGRRILAGVGNLSSPEAARGIAAAARVIAESEDLRTQERALIGDFTRELARIVLDQAVVKSPTEALVYANAVMGLHVAVLERARALALEGLSGRTLATRLTKEAVACIRMLERGLSGPGGRRADIKGGSG